MNMPQLLIPLAFARAWFLNWGASSDAHVSVGFERWTSTLATSALAVVLALSTSHLSRSSIAESETIERLRDFVTQPAVLFLMIVGSLFVAAVTIRLWPTVETR